MFFIKRRAKISRNSPNSNIKNKDILPLNNNWLKAFKIPTITDLDEDKVIKSIKTIESHTRDDYFKELDKIYVPEGPYKLRDQFIEYAKMRKRNGEKENE